MNEKQFFIKSISYSAIILILFAGLIWLIDPFVHYHAPFFGLAVTETDERGQQIGVAKNVSYDTAMIGSSMSENFEASWFNDGVLGNSTVKLCMQGAHFDDYKILLDEVLSKDTTKTVIFCLDNYLLIHDPEDYPSTIPNHLINDSLPDDISYLMNKSVALYYLPQYLINNVRNGYSSDGAYVWADRYIFDANIARASYNPVRLPIVKEEENFDSYYRNAYLFIDGIIPYIKNQPDVSFIFYAPPYSILYWDDCVRQGRLTAEICALSEVYGTLLYNDNVRLFYFQDDFDIITNLDNYKDYSHYSKDINYYLYQCMSRGTCEVTKDNYYDYLLNFSETAADYDYESAFH